MTRMAGAVALLVALSEIVASVALAAVGWPAAEFRSATHQVAVESVSAGARGSMHRRRTARLFGDMTAAPSGRARVGVEYTFHVVAGVGRTSVTPADLKRAAGIIRNRLARLGVTGSVRVKAASNLIVVRIDGAHFATETAPLIAKTGRLMLFDFENDLTGPSLDPNGNPIATPSLYNLLKQVQPQAQKGSPEGYYLFHAKTVTTKPKKGAKSTTTVKQSLDKRGAAPTLKQLLTPVGGKVPPDSQVLKVPANMIVVRCAGASGCIGATSPAGTYYYLMKYFPDRGGEK